MKKKRKKSKKENLKKKREIWKKRQMQLRDGRKKKTIWRRDPLFRWISDTFPSKIRSIQLSLKWLSYQILQLIIESGLKEGIYRHCILALKRVRYRPREMGNTHVHPWFNAMLRVDFSNLRELKWVKLRLIMKNIGWTSNWYIRGLRFLTDWKIKNSEWESLTSVVGWKLGVH